MKNNLRRVIILLAGALVILAALTASVLLQDVPEWCVSPDGSPVGCAEIALSSQTAAGDFYLGDALLAQGQNPGRLVLAADTSHTIDVRNIQDSVEGFGTLFVYQDASASVYVRDGQFRQSTVTLKKQYIRGTLNVTCDVRNYVEGESIGCQVVIDGAGQEGTLMPGGTADYILDPGDHTVTVVLVGDLVGLWSPASAEQTVSIVAGQTKKVAPRFDKAGHLIVTLDQPGVVGDFYLNGELVASQAPGFDKWVQPNTTHKIEVNNFTDPAANGIYTWKDASTTAYLSPGKEKAVEVRLQQQYLKGFLDVTCDVRAYVEGESVGCQVTIDGAPQGGPLAPGATANYVLDPGNHTVNVALTGDMASLWAPASQEKVVGVTAGRTATYKPRFDKAGHLIVNLSAPSIVADFYLNGELVASQANGFDRWVAPNQLQRIEVMNWHDGVSPALQWAINQTTISTTVASSGERTVTFNAEADLAAAEAAIQNLCAGGGGVPLAAAYAGGPGIHPIILFNEGGGLHLWNANVGAWAPSSPLNTQLAACIGPQQEHMIERCYYNGPDILRYQYSRSVRLVAAQSGATIAETQVWGDPPRNCRFSEPWSLTRLDGTSVTWEQVKGWLKPYVEP